MSSRRSIILAIIVAALLTACQGAGADTTTTSSSPLVDLPEPTNSSTTSSSTTTTTPIEELSAPQYQIVFREPTDGPGDELVIELDPTSYDTLTDIDIQDLFAEIVELFPPVWTAHLVDDPAAVAVVVDPDATPEDLDAVGDHYLARLDNGFEITYLGPFAESGSGVLGS